MFSFLAAGKPKQTVHHRAHMCASLPRFHVGVMEHRKFTANLYTIVTCSISWKLNSMRPSAYKYEASNMVDISHFEPKLSLTSSHHYVQWCIVDTQHADDLFAVSLQFGGNRSGKRLIDNFHLKFNDEMSH